MLSNFTLKRTIILLIALVILSIFYFSWIPDPDFEHLDYMPHYMSAWADQYKNFRTAVPFVVLGILLGLLNKLTVYYCFLLFFILVLISEIGQLFITQRNFDKQDIAWGVLGGLIGLLLVKAFEFLFLKGDTIHKNKLK